MQYSAGRTEEDFVKFVNDKTGTQRTVGGSLNENAGRITALDKLAADFAVEAKRTEVLSLAKGVAATHANKAYVRGIRIN